MDDILEAILEGISEIVLEGLFGGMIRLIKLNKFTQILFTILFCVLISWLCFHFAPMAKEIPQIGGVLHIAAYVWGIVSIISGILSVFKILVRR